MTTQNGLVQRLWNYCNVLPLIDAIVEVMRPEAGQRICDPAAGTGGFLLAAHRWIVDHTEYPDPDQKCHLRFDALRGWEIATTSGPRPPTSSSTSFSTWRGSWRSTAVPPWSCPITSCSRAGRVA